MDTIALPEQGGFLPPELEDYVLERRPGLSLSRRGEKVLIIDPDSASWAVLPRRLEEYLGQMLDPLKFSLFCAFNPSMEPRRLRSIVDSMYRHGFITLDGRSFFPPPSVMWRPPDDEPVYPRSFYLHMTDACNFRCTYCYARAEGHGSSLRRETAFAILERIIREIPYDSLYVEFHGGEPLLYRDDIYAIVEYGERRALHAGKMLNFSLQTNGSLFDGEFISFAAAHHLKVGVSIDGPPALHDRFRRYPGGRGTFSDVWENVKRAEALGLHCGIIGVVHDPEDYLEAYEFLVSSGVLSFKLNYSSALGRGRDICPVDEERGRAMARGALAMLRAAAIFNSQGPLRVKIHDFNLYLAALLSKKREYMCLRSPCGAGRSILAFGTGGEIYPCEEMSTYPEFACGTVWSPVPLTAMIDNSAALAKLRARRVEGLEKCRDCPFRRLCSGKCPHKAFHSHGTVMREDPMCSFYRHLFEELMWAIDSTPAIKSLAEPP
ncbi:MAG: radical SAM protein [Candidatus Eremiobacteraeota bacterium]|nr:radical SAM protein [Candidatus Eremiobacteraeota bacterium]